MRGPTIAWLMKKHMKLHLSRATVNMTSRSEGCWQGTLRIAVTEVQSNIPNWELNQNGTRPALSLHSY